MSKILEGKVALVTGGSRGLGATLAEALADQGADVAITYVESAEKADGVVGKLKPRESGRSRSGATRQTRLQPRRSSTKVTAHFGRLDILINNAAIAVQGKTVDDPGLDTFNLDRQWQINVMGTVAMTRAAAPVLTDGGRIIFIGSLLGTHVPFTGAADYAGTKAAIVGYAKGVARDLGARNITVNVIQPGVMPTDMAAEVLGESVPDSLMNLHVIRRIATLGEVSALACFLAGPAGGYMTGGVIDISGGLGI